MIKKFIYFFLICYSLFSYSQKENYVTEFITTKEGLSHNYVSVLLSDDLNMKWIGTENGITKFNGYDFEYIKPNENYSALLNENIETLFIDKNSNLWIGTKSGGLSFLDIKKNEITNYNDIIDIANEGDLRITAVSEDASGNIWVGSWKNGVFVIDVKQRKLIEHYNYYQPIYSIKKDFNNNIWFCSGKRIFVFKDKERELETFNFSFLVTDILSDQSRNKVWVATSGTDKNLYHYDFSTNKFESMNSNVESGFSKTLSIDKFNRIWIGTWRKGIYRSNEDLSDFQKIELVSETSSQLKGNYSTILKIHHDKNNVTWLSTAGGGIVKILGGSGFKNISNQINNEELKDYLNCTSITKNNKKIFIGTLLKGAFFGENYTNLKRIEKLGDVKINTFYAYGNHLYIGTAEGFSIFDLQEEKIIYEDYNLKKVTSFLIDQNKVFIGTQQKGIVVTSLNDIQNSDTYKYYDEDNSNKNRLESNRVTSIVKDNKNRIWVGTYNGIHLYDSENEMFIHQTKLLKNKIPSSIINSIVTRDNKIWLATPNGLSVLKYKDEKLEIQKNITSKNGLNSDFICALTFDNQSNLWFSTHTEIVKYDYIKDEILSFGNINGVKSTSFNNNSFYNDSDENIFFGGIDNITFFNPKEIKYYDNTPDIIFTNLRVNNQIIDYHSGNNILDKSFNYVKEIKLSYTEGFFSTGFVVNDFLGNLNIKYKYIIEGYQNDWIDLQNRNEINFAGLSPGKYTLKIKATRDNINWSEPKILNITLTGSPFKSPIAIVIYILLISSIVFYLVKSNNARIRLQNNLEIANIDKQKEIELTEAKLNFFTNISHEFRTPLTLIVSPIKELLENNNLPQPVYKKIAYIDRNTNRLLDLINQLLDFRKADHGLLKLDVSYGNFVRFSSEVFLYFKEAAEEKNIKYSFKSEVDEINFPFDRNKMEIVLCNLISNALKYTKEGDKIKVSINEDSDYCIISIKDTGIGIKPKNIDKIFDRFYQIKSSNTAKLIGSGIGLSFSKKIVELHHGTISTESEKDKGSTFIVKLSKNPNLYKGEINENFLKSDNIEQYPKYVTETPFENLNVERKKSTILVIDDNPEILNYLKDILSDSYNVIEAENGDIGFKKASLEIPDVIISDVMMPEKDGITLTKELKAQLSTSHIPIILLTARTSTVFEIEGLKTGANDYITKPFDSKVVKARVETLLENREKLRVHLLNKIRFEPVVSEIEKDLDKEDTFINKAILLVEENIDNADFGIDVMTDKLNMSRSSLFRKIKSLTGLSISGFIRSIRLKKAAHLILTTDLNLSQISYEVGFNDYKYFKTSFKKQFKCLPSKYEENFKKTNK